MFLTDFQWDQNPQTLQNGLIHHSTKVYLPFKNPSNEEFDYTFFKFLILSTGLMACSRWQKLPLDGAVDFLSII